MPESQPADSNLANSRGYRLGNSFATSSRLNFQHFIWKDALGYNIHHSIKLPDNAAIADVATGTAIWPVEVAREHPAANIDALDPDFSRVIASEWLPRNITLRSWSLFDKVREDMLGKYDLVHIRLTIPLIENQDPRPVLQSLKKMLKPGGYLQWDDPDYTNTAIKTVDPSIQTPMLHKFREMVLSQGRNSWTASLDDFATQEGFESSVLHRYEDKMDMAGPNMEIYLLSMDEFGSRLQENNLADEGAHIKKLCQEAYRESQEGATMCMGKLTCVANKPYDLTKSTTKSIDSPWYRKDIGPRFKPVTEAAYLKWSGLSADVLQARLHSIRDRAWICAPYPCVGLWMFLMPGILTFPEYPALVARSQQEGVKTLDLGCGLGQNLRLFASEGTPTESMYASDLVADLWDIGYDLFGDEEKMKAHFIQADIFDDSSRLFELDGKMDIIIACQFIHLFDMQGQVAVMKKIVGLTSGPGAVVVGYQRGREVAMKQAMPWGEMFIHDIQTFQEIWEKVGDETGTKWKIDARLVDLQEWGCEKEDMTWMDQDPMGINFVVTRLE
ncbi:Methyltransferase ausD [Lachnellula cervina]|uniref:Methyltransferase ausD n=1 Tax=Lachnellula cervina TaxID=1316786 RepID=A0A7D8YN77_9HELO|nr:Methyltransferase ausD [Lachnellula cervina]